MSSVMKTLLLNPPSFENFDGGASSRWPATREIASFWYPVWLTYPAGMLPGSRLLDAAPHGISVEETIEIARDYEFVVLFTSTVGFASDVKLARAMKQARPGLKITFVGPHVQVLPAQSLLSGSDIDFVVRGEFDHAVVEYAQGKPLAEIANVSYRDETGRIVHNPSRPLLQTEDLDQLPLASTIYKRDLAVEKYNVPFLLHPFVSFYTARGCPAQCTFCLWPQTLSGHAWRTRSAESVAEEFAMVPKLFPQVKEVFFDDDTFNIRKDRVIALSKLLGRVGLRWSCTSRVHGDYESLKAMADGGCRLLIVGFESSDPKILKNIKKGATPQQALTFAQNCKELGIVIHGDFIVGLPGETPQSIERTIEFAKQLDCETIQVSMAHAYPGTELYNWARDRGFLASEAAADSAGHQLPHLEYPGLGREEMMAAVNRFYDEYYFRPRVVWRILRKALWDSHERKRLYNEAVSFMRLRSERLRWARKMVDSGPPRSTLITVPEIKSAAPVRVESESQSA
ncbi:MAG TPA: hopanoid biosynthesis associated radical SAM protein HpnJ [Patescibacteria group bacterium]|nr:hopanoid biosynthesis associated radical SAM protein HpnJ [Patescibacteria group bacterium]